MIELFLDGKPAVVKDSVSIKLTRENVYFTKSGSYTYDVELPLQCTENRAIFGSINRKDVDTQFQEFHAVLRVDNEVLLEGRAIINNVTENSVKVQLLGGNADMNFTRKGSEIYIDELDLGDWMTEVRVYTPIEDDVAHYHGNAMGMFYLENNDMISKGSAQAQMDYWKARWWQNEGTGADQHTIDKGVMFPVINENADFNAESSHLDSGAICNGYILRAQGSSSSGAFYPQFRYTWPNQEDPNVDNFPQAIPSFQPMLIMMVRKVMKAAGYPLEQASEIMLLSNPLFRHIFIVTANNRIELNRALPHWTFNDFLTQIERFFGIVIEANESTHTSHIVSRDDWWNNTPTVIEEVVDEYSVEVSKADTSDITNGNIGFEDMGDDEMHIGDDILRAATVDKTTYETFANLLNAIRNHTVTDDDKAKIYEVQGHHFILCKDDNSNYYWKEVNQYRMLQRNANKSDVDVTLKIKPCPIVTWDCPVVVTTPNPRDTRYNMDQEITTMEVNVFSRPDTPHIGTDEVDVDTSKLDIEALLAGEQEVPSSEDGEDVMYVGIVPPDIITRTKDNVNYYYPDVRSYPSFTIDSLGVHRGVGNNNEYLVLNPMPDFYNSKTLFSESLDGETAIDTTVKYCVKFVSDKVLPSTGLFIINNIKYACEKLEYNITSKGVSPLVTGYFYRIAD